METPLAILSAPRTASMIQSGNGVAEEQPRRSRMTGKIRGERELDKNEGYPTHTQARAVGRSSIVRYTHDLAI